MGVDGQRLEMLFLAPGVLGQGIGKQLLLYGIQRLGVQELTVNAQNANAVAFYRHFGFTVYKRTELDEAVRRIRCCICAWQMVKANEKI